MHSSLLKMYQIVNSANPKVFTRSLILLFLQANEGLLMLLILSDREFALALLFMRAEPV